ncbi:MAG TPA: alpha/beta hydrolase [Candidatus Dormibacteraeota bacterium]|nr:alpha/beta hydrolase [Candidatus Dormibacteraeota bacterium]
MEIRKRSVPALDGRRLDVIDCGKVGDPAVVVHHGTPGAKQLFGGWLADADEKGIRLIGYSRPGYGASTRAPGRAVGDAAVDVAAIADQLEISRLATWGYSGGGPHALSCAGLLGDRVVATAAIACPAPYGAEGLDFLAGMGQANIEEFEAVLQGEASIRPLHEAAAQAMPTSVEGMIGEMKSILSAPDQAAIREHLGSWFVSILTEAVSEGADGWIDDDLAFVSPWGFELAEVSVPLQLWQGQHDLMVPSLHGHWLAAKLPEADWHYLPDAGHLTLLVDQVPLIHAWLLEHF